MLLTIMELWVAVDNAAARFVPLLLEYDTGFPTGGRFDGLVLPKKEQLQRLARIEDHLERRRQLASHNEPPWQLASHNEPPWQLHGRSSRWSKVSFAVRYYDASPAHQRLHRRVMARWRAERAAKVAGWIGRKRREFWHRGTLLLARRAGTLQPESPSRAEPHYWDPMDPWGKRKRGRFGRLRAWYRLKRRRLDDMIAQLLSPPLPSNKVVAKAIVFEANLPAVIAAWRDATLTVVVELFYADSIKRSYPRGSYASSHPMLRHFIEPQDLARTESLRFRFTWGESYRSGSSYSFTNAMGFDSSRNYHCNIYDSQLGRRLSRSLSQQPSRLLLCPYAPETLPKVLMEWTVSIDHTSNQVLARQHECPHDMTLAEFRAFGHLRSGVLLQWHNVLQQLALPSLNLNRAETWYLFAQASNEAGPRAAGQGALRQVHGILADEQFGSALASALQDALGRLSDNWESSWVCACILIGVATKLLSVSPSRAVQERCLGSLRRIRHLAMGWVRRLMTALRCLEAEPGERRCMGQNARLMSLVCHATFDVGAARFATVLSDSAESAILVEACLRAAEHAPPPTTDSKHPIADMLVYRWRRLSLEVEPWLGDDITCRGNPCLDAALKNVWPAYSRGAAWERAPASYSHVLVARSLPAGDAKDSLSLQYDLLTGCLTVDGSPFSTLPSPYQEHETYRRMFGDYVFTVVPSRMRDQGMQFSATSTYHGHEVHFGLFSDNELIVRSEAGGRRYELIPVGHLNGEFPTPLVAGYAHWLVLDGSDTIEFRPLDNAWQTPQEAGASWEGLVLEGASTETAARLFHRDRHVAIIDTRSKTARLVRDLFRKIERPDLINMAFDRTRSVIQVQLPRYRLAFSMVAGQTTMVSAQYKDYAIDADQSMGTLVGLENRLVLRRPCETSALLDSRLVLIPAGDDISPGPVGAVDARVSSTAIAIGGDPSLHIKHHAFEFDCALGRLKDSGTVHSKLLLCYLHAITSYCLPDRLTGRTGTEEALRILNSAAVQSFDGLTEDDVSLVGRIAALSPLRVYSHPTQASTWPPSFALVDDRFYLSARSLVSRAEVCALISPAWQRERQRERQREWEWERERGPTAVLPRSDPRLGWRASARGPPYVIPTTRRGKNDTEYGKPAARTSLKSFDAEIEAGRLARYMVGRSTGVDGGTPGLLYPVSSLAFLANLEERTSQYPAPLKPEFCYAWLRSPGSFSLDVWYNTLQRLRRRRRRPSYCPYTDMWFLAGLLFAPGANLELIQLLLTACTALPDEDEEEEAPKFPLERYLRFAGAAGIWAAKRCREWSDRWTRSKKGYFAALASRTARLPLIDHSDSRVDTKVKPSVRSRAAVSATDTTTLASIDDLFRHQPPPILAPTQRPIDRSRLGEYLIRSSSSSSSNSMTPEFAQPTLPALLDRLDALCQLEHERKYVAELRESHDAFCDQDGEAPRSDDIFALRTPANGDCLIRVLVDYMKACRQDVEDAFAAICRGLTANISALGQAALPVITSMLLLERLSRQNRPRLPDSWRRCLVDYAVRLTALQRAERMVVAAHHDDGRELVRELLNVGHENWDPMQHPDWLLFEVESGILIRPVQTRVARAMIDPPGGRNRVMQLDMGEGKSSVIVPMVASQLADGSRLVRVLVAKPQRRQMMDTL